MRLPAQSRIQRIHRTANGLGITRGIGLLKRLGGLQHRAVACAQCGICLLARSGLAVECFINGFAKCVPQLLFKPALQWHGMRFGLPTLLQRLDRVNVQNRRGAQHLGLFNHGVALLHAELLQGFQRRGCSTNGCQPKRLQFVKRLFAQVTGITPTVTELMQDAVKPLPVVIQCGRVGGCPSLDLLDQRQSLRPMLGGVQLDFFKPGFNHFVGLIAGFVKTLPKPVVGYTTLIGLFPLFAQCPQVVLHLAPTQFVPGLAFEQAFGLGDQLFTQLVCAPALPALEFTSGGQGGMGLAFELVADDAAKLLERVAQCVGSPGAGLAMAFGYFKLQPGQHFLHGGLCLRLDLRINLWFLWFWRCLNRHATPGSQFIGPERHGRQRCVGVVTCRNRLGQCRLECIPNHQQLGTRCLQQRRKLGVDAGPVGVGLQRNSLILPMTHVDTQRVPNGLRIAPGLHGQHFDALRQQNRRLALNLHPVLQVFNHLDAVRQLRLERGQRLFGQRRTGFGSIALPGQGVGNVQLGHGQQCLGFGGPFSGNCILTFGALDLIELFAQQLGSAFVAAAEFLENFCDFFHGRGTGKPFAYAGRALARRRRCEGTTGEFIKLANVVVFWG